MVNVSEQVHGVYTSHFGSNTAHLPNVPLGTINNDREAYRIAMANKEEAEIQ